MIGLDLALSLRAAGLRWTPRPGDRFILPNRGMDEDVFVLSDMTVEVHRFPTGSVIGFNGVTEWALDSIDQHEAVWMPAEHQLRELLGGLFVRLESGDDGFAVTLELPSGRSRHRASTAEDAYGQALLAVLREVTGSYAEPTVR
ncbi:MAG TPA: pilus assembly protein CpaE [Kineosporiaceae bacterium]|nr:pilus assembly protein CpaE [Kineosporiaceae bacterium]